MLTIIILLVLGAAGYLYVRSHKAQVAAELAVLKTKFDELEAKVKAKL